VKRGRIDFRFGGRGKLRSRGERDKEQGEWRDVGGVSRRRYLILHRSRLFLWKDKRISVKQGAWEKRRGWESE